MSSHTVSGPGRVDVRCSAAIRVAMIVGGTCTLVGGAAAQTAPALTKGIRVRVVMPAADSQPERFVTGSLLRLERDTVVLWTGDTTQTIALNGDRRLEALARGNGHAGVGAGIGAVVGALAGGVIGAATYPKCEGWDCIGDPGPVAGWAAGAFVGAGGGALVGLVIGSAIPSETWVPVQTADVHVTMAHGAVGINLAFWF